MLMVFFGKVMYVVLTQLSWIKSTLENIVRCILTMNVEISLALA